MKKDSAQSLRFIDTHCHIHDSEFAEKFGGDVTAVLFRARAEGVDTCICIGTDAKSSLEAVAFARTEANVYATLALHPHEVALHTESEIDEQFAVLEEILAEGTGGIVGIGECGLDYFYHEEELIKTRQRSLLRRHIELALRYDLPLSFHIRDAFDDFFKICDEFKGLRGVVHSFSAGTNELEGVLSRGLYVGLNGIMTFSKQTDQLEAARMVPLEKMVLETDAPFLTPAPFRGTMCEPKHLRTTASYLAELRGEDLEVLARETTRNATQLFGI